MSTGSKNYTWCIIYMAICKSLESYGNELHLVQHNYNKYMYIEKPVFRYNNSQQTLFIFQLHVHVLFVVRLIKQINCSNKTLSNKKHKVFLHELLVTAGSVALSLEYLVHFLEVNPAAPTSSGLDQCIFDWPISY